MSINNFSQYMADLCSRHVDILHNPDGDIHFIDSGAEKDVSLDSILCYPAVIIEKGHFQYVGSDGAMGKEYDYMIFVLDHVSDTGDFNQIRAVNDKCEQILDELFNQVVEDKRLRKYKFLSGFSLSGTEVDPIENVDNALYGVMGMFSLEFSYVAKNCRKPFR